MTKRIRIVPDNDYQWDDDMCKIAYPKSRRGVLGTEALSSDEMSALQDRVNTGEVKALPVYAYVHSGVALSTAPFNDPWDSWRSGFVYSEDAGVTDDMLREYVETYNKYLAGDVWGFVVEEAVELIGQQEDGTTVERKQWVELDSCWGFLGSDPEQNGMQEYAEDWLKQGCVWTDEKGNTL